MQLDELWPDLRSGPSWPIERRVHCATLVAWGFAACSLLALFGLPAATQGWTAAAGAMLVFGASSLPAKHPAAAKIGPLGFQLWVTMGNSGASTLLLLLMRVPLRWGAWGTVGAATLTCVQIFAWPAIQRLGAAVGPGIWCGVGMATSFVWGVLVFEERMRSPPLVAAALVALAAGVAASQALAAGRQGDLDSEGALAAVDSAAGEASGAAPPEHETPPSTPSRVEPLALPLLRWRFPRTKLIVIGCALCTGVLDGSLMAPFSASLREPSRAPSLGDERVPAKDEELVALSYLSSFTLGLPLIALPALFCLTAAQSALAARRGAAGTSVISTQRVPPVRLTSARRHCLG